MTRNEIFEEAIIHALCDPKPELPRAEITARVKGLVPDTCVGDWEKGVDGALQRLQVKGIVTSRLIPGYATRKYWKLVL